MERPYSEALAGGTSGDDATQQFSAAALVVCPADDVSKTGCPLDDFSG